MTTKVKQFTGGVPNSTGDGGSLKQILIKASNDPGDYVWADPPPLSLTEISHDDSSMAVRLMDGNIEVIVNGALVGTFADPGTLGLTVNAINNYAVAADFVNHPAPPADPIDMLTVPNDITKYNWTPDQLAALILEAAPLPEQPTGTIAPFAGTTPPTGWLECDGTSYDLEGQYSRLGTVLQDTYNGGGGVQIGDFEINFYNLGPDTKVRHGGFVDGHRIIVYRDTTQPAGTGFRLQKENEWDIPLPGRLRSPQLHPVDGDSIVRSGNRSGNDYFDYDNAGNVYVRVEADGADFIVKVDSDGNVVAESPRGAGWFVNFAVNKNTEEVYYANVYLRSYIRKTNNILEPEWELFLDGGGIERYVTGIEVDEDKDEVIIIKNRRNVRIVNSAGVILHSDNLGSEALVDVTQLSDGRVYVGGQENDDASNNHPAGRHRYWVYNSSNLNTESHHDVYLERTQIFNDSGLSHHDFERSVWIRGVYQLDDGFVYAVEEYNEVTYIFKIDPDTITGDNNDREWVSFVGIPTPGLDQYSNRNDIMTHNFINNSVMLAGYKLGMLGEGSASFNSFQVPDLRGYWARGWDHGRGVDSGRAFGSAQDYPYEQKTPDPDTTLSNVALMYCIKT